MIDYLGNSFVRFRFSRFFRLFSSAFHLVISVNLLWSFTFLFFRLRLSYRRLLIRLCLRFMRFGWSRLLFRLFLSFLTFLYHSAEGDNHRTFYVLDSFNSYGSFSFCFLSLISIWTIA